MPGETSDLLALTPFIGEWSVEADLPPPGPAGVAGRTSFAWLLGQRFVVQNAVVEHADAPDAHMIIAPDARRPGGYLQHYFDSRGVVRVYEMTFDAGRGRWSEWSPTSLRWISPSDLSACSAPTATRSPASGRPRMTGSTGCWTSGWCIAGSDEVGLEVVPIPPSGG